MKIIRQTRTVAKQYVTHDSTIDKAGQYITLGEKPHG